MFASFNSRQEMVYRYGPYLNEAIAEGLAIGALYIVNEVNSSVVWVNPNRKEVFEKLFPQE